MIGIQEFHLHIHHIAYCISTFFQDSFLSDTWYEKKTPQISGQAPLCALWHHIWWCSEEGLFRRRILVSDGFGRHMKTGTYRALDFDLNFSCRALWHSFRLEDLPIRVGKVMMRKKKPCLSFHVPLFWNPKLFASFWSTLNVAKQWLLYNDRRWVQVVFYLYPPWKSQHRQPKYKILVSFFCFSRLNEPDSSQFSIHYHLNFLGVFFLLQLSIFHWICVRPPVFMQRFWRRNRSGFGMQVSIVDIYRL